MFVLTQYIIIVPLVFIYTGCTIAKCTITCFTSHKHSRQEFKDFWDVRADMQNVNNPGRAKKEPCYPQSLLDLLICKVILLQKFLPSFHSTSYTHVVYFQLAMLFHSHILTIVSFSVTIISTTCEIGYINLQGRRNR